MRVDPGNSSTSATTVTGSTAGGEGSRKADSRARLQLSRDPQRLR